MLLCFWHPQNLLPYISCSRAYAVCWDVFAPRYLARYGGANASRPRLAFFVRGHGQQHFHTIDDIILMRHYEKVGAPTVRAEDAPPRVREYLDNVGKGAGSGHWSGPDGSDSLGLTPLFHYLSALGSASPTSKTARQYRDEKRTGVLVAFSGVEEYVHKQLAKSGYCADSFGADGLDKKSRKSPLELHFSALGAFLPVQKSKNKTTDSYTVRYAVLDANGHAEAEHTMQSTFNRGGFYDNVHHSKWGIVSKRLVLDLEDYPGIVIDASFNELKLLEPPGDQVTTMKLKGRHQHGHSKKARLESCTAAPAPKFQVTVQANAPRP